MNVFVLSGLKEESNNCYELSSFGEVFIDFELAKLEAKDMYDEILKSHSIDMEEEFDLIEDDDSFSVSILSDGLRFELFISKKELPTPSIS